MIVKRRIFQHGGGDREHEPFRDRAAQEQDIVDEKPVNTAVAILEGMHEDEAVGDGGGMDNGGYRTFFHHPGGR